MEAQPTDLTAFPVHLDPDRAMTSDQAARMLEPVEEAEIAQVIAGLARGKRAGPDGLPNDFYHDYRDLLGPVLLRVYRRIQAGHSCPDSFAEAAIFPIRKNGDSPNPKDYRPISFLNTSYKIFARLLARRLAASLPRLVDQVQNGFVHGRRMHHSVDMMMAALATYDPEGDGDAEDTPCVVLLDFEKAYDTVDRSFMFSVLRHMRFPEELVSVIERMHDSTTARFLANGEYSTAFNVTRGIRQGCPLAAFLFLLVMEPLAQHFQPSPTTPHNSSTDNAEPVSSATFVVSQVVPVQPRLAGHVMQITIGFIKEYLGQTWVQSRRPIRKPFLQVRCAKRHVLHGVGVIMTLLPPLVLESESLQNSSHRSDLSIKPDLTSNKHEIRYKYDFTFMSVPMLMRSLGLYACSTHA